MMDVGGGVCGGECVENHGSLSFVDTTVLRTVFEIRNRKDVILSNQERYRDYAVLSEQSGCHLRILLETPFRALLAC